MHILKTESVIDLGPQGSFGPGEFIMEDGNCGELMAMKREVRMTLRPWDRPATSLADATRILVHGGMGFGDTLMLTPCLREIKRLAPNAELHVACFNEHRQVFLGLPYVDGFADIPVPLALIDNYSAVLTLEHAVEFNPRAREQHMTDRFAEHLGLPELTDRMPDYIVAETEREWIESSFPRKPHEKRIAVQIQAGVPCRTYPGKHLGLLLPALVRDGYTVYVLGRPGEFQIENRAGLVNLTRQGLTFRQSAAFIASSDVFFGPDSGLLHVAGTLGVPAVGVFGPFPWDLRTCYYKSVFSIQGRQGCEIGPCFHTQHAGIPPYPANGPCATSGRCELLADILPERVLAKINSVASAPTAAVD